MESDQSIAIENPSDAQFKDEPTKPGSDTAAANQLTGGNNPDEITAAMAPLPSGQNPENGNSGAIEGYQSTQVSGNRSSQNGVSSMILDQQGQQYLEGILI